MWFFVSISVVDAQNIASPDIDLLMQEIFVQSEGNLNYEEIYDNFYALITDPIDLNRAEITDLQKLHLLSDQQIQSFFAYKQKNGRFLSIYELQAVPLWNISIIQKLLPFVNIRELELHADNRTLWQRITQEKNNYVLLRWSRTLERKKGYAHDITHSYLGSPNRLFMRFRVSHTQDFSFGFKMEKDAGEAFVVDPRSKKYGFDYYSGHAMIMNQYRLKKLVLGDYKVQIGQGLISSAGFSLGKGSESVQTVKRNSLGILPYTSTTEFGFFRGLAFAYQTSQNTVLTAFLSRKKLDALPIFNADSSKIIHFQSLIKSGYHRTESEYNKKSLLGQGVLGGHLAWNLPQKNIELGFTVLHTQYDQSIIPNKKVYQIHDFHGKRNTNFGFHYSKIWNNFNFFGEFAFTPNLKHAFINGLMAHLSDAIDIAVLWRNYSPLYHSFFSNSFGENAINRNESGLYFGLKYTPRRAWKWTIYYDHFRFPWLKYQASAPSTGYDFMTQILHQFSREVSTYFRFKIKNKEKDILDQTGKKMILKNALKLSYQFNIDYSIRNRFSMRSRVQYSTLRHGNQDLGTGFVILQDFNMQFKKSKISTRFALFDTDNFDNRQYVYEKDVLYYFAMPVYYGLGLRSYVLFQQKIRKNIDIWFKYSVYSYSNRRIIGSGLETIYGNRKRDIRFQLRYRF